MCGQPDVLCSWQERDKQKGTFQAILLTRASADQVIDLGKADGIGREDARLPWESLPPPHPLLRWEEKEIPSFLNLISKAAQGFVFMVCTLHSWFASGYHVNKQKGWERGSSQETVLWPRLLQVTCTCH